MLEVNFSIEDMIPDETVVVTISHLGYMKRTSLSEYKLQNRGGVGSKGTATRDADFLEQLFVATTHNYLLVFTEKGKCFWMRVYEVPEGTKVSQGRAIQNLINLESDDKIMAYVNVKDIKDPEYTQANNIIMCTKKGVIKKTSLEAYSRPRTNGVNAINIREEDQLIEAKLTTGNCDILMGLRSGKAIRFHEEKVRSIGRTGTGVRGITLSSDTDEVIGMVCVDQTEEESSVLVVSDKGYGKRTDLEAYRITNRGGKGVKALNVTDKTGELVSMKSVTDNDDVMIINKSGVTIRLEMDQLRVMGRNTQGVKLINLKNNDEIAAVAKIELSEEDIKIRDEERLNKENEEEEGDNPSDLEENN